MIMLMPRFTFGPYLMESHVHAWTHVETPHVSLPSQPIPTSYPVIEPYPAETTPLIARMKIDGYLSLRILKAAEKSLKGFLNPPMIGGMLAIVAGVIPFIRGPLFEGRILRPWVTQR